MGEYRAVTEYVVALEPGELVKDGFFTLFDSVAALEVGIYVTSYSIDISLTAVADYGS